MSQELHEQIMSAKVILINTTVLIGTTLADIEVLLKIILVALTILYTCWKWYRDVTKKDDK